MIEDANDEKTHCQAESNSNNFLGFCALHVCLDQRAVEKHEDRCCRDKRHKKCEGEEGSPCLLKPVSIFSDQSTSVLDKDKDKNTDLVRL